MDLDVLEPAPENDLCQGESDKASERVSDRVSGRVSDSVSERVRECESM